MKPVPVTKPGQGIILLHDQIIGQRENFLVFVGKAGFQVFFHTNLLANLIQQIGAPHEFSFSVQNRNRALFGFYKRLSCPLAVWTCLHNLAGHGVYFADQFAFSPGLFFLRIPIWFVILLTTKNLNRGFEIC